MKGLLTVLLACTTVAVASSCSESTAPEPNPPPALDIEGSFGGFWTVVVADTGFTCGGLPSICYHPMLARFECPTVMDVEVTGDSTFTGIFANDAGGCVSVPEPPNEPYLARLGASASFTASALAIESFEVPSGNWLYVSSEVTVDAGDKRSYESLFGCTPFDDWIVGAAYADMGIEVFGDRGQDPSHENVFTGTIRNRDWPSYLVMSRTFSNLELPASCAGQVVVLFVDFVVGR